MKLKICFEDYKFVLFVNPLFMHLDVIYVMFSDAWFQLQVNEY